MYILKIFLELLFVCLQVLGKIVSVTGIMFGQWYLLKTRVLKQEKKKKWINLLYVVLLVLAMWGLLAGWQILGFLIYPILEGLVFAYSAFIIVAKLVSDGPLHPKGKKEKFLFILVITLPALVLGLHYLMYLILR